MWGDDDNKFGLRALIGRTAKQRAQNGQITQKRDLPVQIAAIILQQPCNGKAFTIAHFHRGRGLPPFERADRQRARVQRIGAVNRRYRRIDDQIYQIAIHHCGHKVQLDTKGFEFNGNLAALLRNRHGIFAARQKFGLLA